MKSIRKGLVFLFSVFAFAVFSGCAGTIPTAEFKKPIDANMRLCANDEANVQVVAAEGVKLSDVARQRLEGLVQKKIADKKKLVRCKTDAKRSFNLDGKITHYEEGSAFARMMLAGLGKINIEGDFILNTVPVSSAPVAEFSASKTFAWGGAYGGSTTILDVEPSFAEAVANAVVASSP